MKRHISPTATGVSSIGTIRMVRNSRVPRSRRSSSSASPSPIGSWISQPEPHDDQRRAQRFPEARVGEGRPVVLEPDEARRGEGAEGLVAEREPQRHQDRQGEDREQHRPAPAAPAARPCAGSRARPRRAGGRSWLPARRGPWMRSVRGASWRPRRAARPQPAFSWARIGFSVSFSASSPAWISTSPVSIGGSASRIAFSTSGQTRIWG